LIPQAVHPTQSSGPQHNAAPSINTAIRPARARFARLASFINQGREQIYLLLLLVMKFSFFP